MFIAQIAFNLLLFIIWPFSLIHKGLLVSRRKKRLHELKLLISQVDHRWNWDRDILNERKSNQLKEIKEKARGLSNGNLEIEKIETFLNDSIKALQQISPSKLGFLKEWVELLVVVFGVVMGARSLLLQPFKIPTGSMQPTLFGITFEPMETVDINIFDRIYDYVNYSFRYVDEVIREDGYLSLHDRRGTSHITQKNPFFFFPYTILSIGDQKYKLPGDADTVLKYISLQNRPSKIDSGGSQRFYFKKGDILARGALKLGDHLFVDRVRLNFTEPKRGDITVFVTDGIADARGNSLRGRFFIKRLVGIPGDELKIIDRRLYVREKGKDTFVLVDGSFNPAFDRMYSYKGGYKGYSQPQHPLCQYLRNEKEVFQLKNDQYFMLGDNSENSQDSRFWGIVPRINIVGRANFVYWPFSRRWGFADSVSPEEFDSLPQKR